LATRPKKAAKRAPARKRAAKKTTVQTDRQREKPPEEESTEARQAEEIQGTEEETEVYYTPEELGGEVRLGELEEQREEHNRRTGDASRSGFKF
jgi:hypothetical protein